MANRINIVFGIDISQLERTLNRTQKRLDRLSNSLRQTGATLTQSLTLPLGLAAGASIRAFAQFEKLEKGLVAVTGNAELAAEELQLLREVAKLPGLGFQEAVQGSVNLQAVGLSAEQARKTLVGFGAALAVTGGGKNELSEVQRQLTQIISKNRILQEDYGVLQERVPLIGNALQAAFGTRNIENVRKLGISGKEFVERISEALAQLPETQSVTGGLANAFENLEDSVTLSAVSFGKAIADAINLESILNTLADSVAAVVGWFQSLTPETQRTILIITGITAAIGPLLIGISGLTKLVSLATAGFAALASPVGLIIIAVGLLAAAYLSLNSRMREGEAVRKTLNQLEKSAAQNSVEQRTAVDLLVKRLKDENTSNDEKKRILNELKQISPEYFGQLRLNKTLTEDVTAAQKLFNAELLRTAKIEAAKGQLVEIEKQLLNVVEASRPSVLQSLANGFVNYGNAAALAAKQVETFSGNLAQNKKNLEAQRDALVNVVSGLVSQGPVTTLGGGGGDEPTSPAAPIGDGAIKKLQEYTTASTRIRIEFNAWLASIRATKVETSLLNKELLKIKDVESPLKRQEELLFSLDEQLNNTAKSGAALGKSLGETLQAQVSLTEQAVTSAIEQFGANSLAVEILAETLGVLKERLAEITEQQLIFAQVQNVVASSFESGASAIEKSGSIVQQVLKATARGALQAAASFAKAKIIEGITSVIADSFKKFGIFGAAIAGGAGALAGSIFQIAINKITAPKLAAGGITTGPTLALIGDNPSGREAVIPFEKMGQFLDMAGAGRAIRVTGLFEVKGSDLILVLDRAKQDQIRIR